MKVRESKQLKANYRQVLKKEIYVNTEDVKKHRERRREIRKECKTNKDVRNTNKKP
jgi:hypothetical protein